MAKRRQHIVEGRYYRINEAIHASQVRVIDLDKGQIGILSREEALKKAEEKNLDLVEVAPSANPPVVKLINFAKFKYQQAKKRKLSKGASPETKQLRFRPFMDDHDLNVRIRKIKKFLKNGDRVKIQIRFFGREITKKHYGFELIDRIMDALGNLAKLHDKPRQRGKTIEALIIPK